MIAIAVVIGVAVVYLQRPRLLPLLAIAVIYLDWGLGAAIPNLRLPTLVFIAAGGALLLTSMPRRVPAVPWGLVLCAVLGFTVMVRGIGISALGSSTIGGTAYLDIAAALVVAYALPRARLSDREWHLAITLMLLLPCLGVAVELAAFSGVVEPTSWFVELFARDIGLSDGPDDLSLGSTRLVTAGLAGVCLAAYGGLRFTQRRGLSMVCICLGLALILLSGHRLFIATVGLFAILLWRLTTRPSVAMVAGAASIAVVAWMAVSLADQLPSSAQRALSFVPGVADDTEVGEQATTTIDWRLEVWRNAMNDEVADHVLLGKGYSYEPIAGLTVSPEWASLTSNYHSGPLVLLVPLGVVGLVAGLAIPVTLLWHSYHRGRRRWHRTALRRPHRVVLALAAAEFVVFLTLFGSVHTYGRLVAITAASYAIADAGTRSPRRPRRSTTSAR